MSNEKQTIRIEARKNLERLSFDPASRENIRDIFFKNISLNKNQVVAAYWAVKREIDTLPLIDALIEKGFQCALPVISGNKRKLDFALWDGKTPLIKGPFAIPQPDPKTAAFVEPDIFIIPLLAFDRQGLRLGQGAGHYDATLAYYRQKKEISAIGVAYAEQACLFNLPQEDHDQKLDMVITPLDVLRF